MTARRPTLRPNETLADLGERLAAWAATTTTDSNHDTRGTTMTTTTTTPPTAYWPSYQSAPSADVDWMFDIYCPHLYHQLGPCSYCDDLAYIAHCEAEYAEFQSAQRAHPIHDYDTRPDDVGEAMAAEMEAHRYDHIPTQNHDTREDTP